jgi:signal transduction histidine kinase/CheY-like chemotaxis protein
MTPPRTAFSRLFLRYALLITVPVCGLLVLVGIVDVTAAWRDNVSQSGQLLAERARAVAVRVEERLGGIEAQVRAVAEMPWSEGVLGSADREFEFRRLQRVVPELAELRHVDAQGRGLKVSQLERNEAGVMDSGEWADVPPNQVAFGNALFRAGVDPYAWMTIGTRDGRTAALVNMKFVSDYVSGLRFGDTGRAFIVDRAGYVMAHPDLRTVLQRINLSRHPSLAAALRPGVAGAVEAESLDGRAVFTSAHPIGRSGWWAVVEQSSDEVLAPVRAAALRAIGVLLAGVACAIALALFLARRMSAPVVDLRQAAARIGAGDLGARAHVATGDEVQDLGEEFNRMAERLQSSYAKLEARVIERTQELARKRDEADQANAAKTRFLAAASHDLRQPMHAVGLLVGILEQRLDREELRVLAQKARESVESMEELFRALLDISKLDAGAMRAFIEPVRLGDVFTMLEQQFGPDARAKGLALRFGRADFVVDTDAAMLSRILSNLLSNAIHYTHHGHIRVGCRRRGPHVEVLVVDTGAGIEPQYEERVFSEFFQVPGVDRQGGLGLGLSIVQRSAQLLGHRLVLRSWPARGSVFSLELPLSSRAPEAEPVDEKPASGSLKTAFVVVLDDHPDNRFATRAWFEQWGCHVVCGGGSESVCSQLRSHLRTPDLVVADLRLANGEDGMRAIEQIRRAIDAPVPALLVTGDVTYAPPPAADGGGAIRVLHKPLSAASLRAAAAALIALNLEAAAG